MVIPIDKFRETRAMGPVSTVPPKKRPDDDPPPASQALAA
jgi:hypothetical protein